MNGAEPAASIDAAAAWAAAETCAETAASCSSRPPEAMPMPALLESPAKSRSRAPRPIWGCAGAGGKAAAAEALLLRGAFAALGGASSSSSCEARLPLPRALPLPPPRPPRAAGAAAWAPLRGPPPKMDAEAAAPTGTWLASPSSISGGNGSSSRPVGSRLSATPPPLPDPLGAAGACSAAANLCCRIFSVRSWIWTRISSSPVIRPSLRTASLVASTCSLTKRSIAQGSAL
mmetsp:Transcript_8815/g.19608  ORF Transcript_8815/g.19608 Transcript_8815/m.19608 type:complete len:232 (-) Transcript_8815:1555-2250(-)